MNIFSCEDNIFKFEDRFPKFDFSYLPHDFIFVDDKNEFEFPIIKNVQKTSVEQESLKNMRLACINSISGRSETTNDEFAPTIVPFIEGVPDINKLEEIVNNEINEKGYNATVLDCLDIDFDDDKEEDCGNIIRKKQQKSRSQIKALKVEYNRKPNWTKKCIKRIAQELGLTTYQVYKWHWDYSKKQEKNEIESINSHKRARTFE